MNQHETHSARLLRQPLPHGIIHPGLPAFAGGAQTGQHIGVKTDRGGNFGSFKERATARAAQLGPRFKKFGWHHLIRRAGTLEALGIKLACIGVSGDVCVDLGVFLSIWAMQHAT